MATTKKEKLDKLKLIGGMTATMGLIGLGSQALINRPRKGQKPGVPGHDKPNKPTRYLKKAKKGGKWEKWGKDLAISAGALGLGALAVIGGGSAMQKKWKKKEASSLRFKQGGAVPSYYDKGGKLNLKQKIGLAAGALGTLAAMTTGASMKQNSGVWFRKGPQGINKKGGKIK